MNKETNSPSASTDETNGKHFYIWGVPGRGEEVQALLRKHGIHLYEGMDYIYYNENILIYNDSGYANFVRRGYDEALINLITSNWTELKLPYNKPKDKELVWCWNNDYNFERDLCFYDAENNSILGCATGSRFCGGCFHGHYDNYAPYEGEYPDWAKEALKKLKD